MQATTSPWGGLTGVPAGFADGTDDDTTYTAGAGLSLIGSEFSLATTTQSLGLAIKGSVVTRNTGTCPGASCEEERVYIPIGLAPGSTDSVDLSTSTIAVTYIDGDDFGNLAWNANADSTGTNLGWEIDWLNSAADVLNPTEQIQLIVNINDGGTLVTTRPGASASFIIEVKPAAEEVLQVAGTLPSEIISVVALSDNQIGVATSTESLGLAIKGNVVSRNVGSPLLVERVIIPIGVAPGGTESVDLSTSTISVTYIDSDDFANLAWNGNGTSTGANAGWEIDWLNSTPDLLDPTEQVQLVVNINDGGSLVTTRPGASDSFIIEIKPAMEKVLQVARTLPPEMTAVATLGNSSTGITLIQFVNISTAITVDVQNTGNTSVSDFANMEYVIQYTTTAGGGTETAEIMAYVAGSSANGTWDILSITPDSVQPGVWDPGETIRMSGNLSGTPQSGTTGAVWVSTPDGAVTGGTFVVP